MTTITRLERGDRGELEDRTRAGRVGRSGGVVLGVSIREYFELEAGTRWPTSEVWHRICELYGWPQTFVRSR